MLNAHVGMMFSHLDKKDLHLAGLHFVHLLKVKGLVSVILSTGVESHFHSKLA